MPIVTLLGCTSFSLAFFSIALCFTLTNRLCLYWICRRSLKKISRKIMKNKPLLFRYKDEHTMKSLDELLLLVTKTSELLKNSYEASLKNFPHPLQLYAYVDECKQRTIFHFKTLENDKEKKEVYKRKKSWFRDSCYFCSQPILFPSWNKAAITEGEGKLRVPCCPCCQSALENSHKVNTLCFVENGKKLHWQESQNYQPQFLYWNINQDIKAKYPLKKRGKFLRLVRKQTRDNLIKKG